MVTGATISISNKKFFYRNKQGAYYIFIWYFKFPPTNVLREF